MSAVASTPGVRRWILRFPAIEPSLPQVALASFVTVRCSGSVVGHRLLLRNRLRPGVSLSRAPSLSSPLLVANATCGGREQAVGQSVGSMLVGVLVR